MSSNDRYNRSNRPRQGEVPAEPLYEDEIVYEDQWELDADIDAAPDTRPQGQSSPRRSHPPRQQTSPATPSLDGTAAQLDRLRRNIRQSSRSTVQAPAVPETRRPTRPASQAVSRPQIQDDYIVDDAGYVDDEPYQAEPPRQRRTTQARPTTGTRQRQPRRAVSDESYEDDHYAAEAYDGYDAYEDDFSEYDAPRRPARQPRAKPQFTMPAISRPSLPPAIAHADLVNDAPALGIIGAGLASLAAMAILVANRADSLAPEFATHVSASGILENFRDESALWNLPLMAAMFTLMNIVMAWFISPLDRFASRFVLVGALVVQFLAWVAIIRIL